MSKQNPSIISVDQPPSAAEIFFKVPLSSVQREVLNNPHSIIEYMGVNMRIREIELDNPRTQTYYEGQPEQSTSYACEGYWVRMESVEKEDRERVSYTH